METLSQSLETLGLKHNPKRSMQESYIYSVIDTAEWYKRHSARMAER